MVNFIKTCLVLLILMSKTCPLFWNLNCTVYASKCTRTGVWLRAIHAETIIMQNACHCNMKFVRHCFGEAHVVRIRCYARQELFRMLKMKKL